MITENGAIQSSSFLNQFKKMHKTTTCWNAISKLMVVEKMCQSYFKAIIQTECIVPWVGKSCILRRVNQLTSQ